MSIIKNSKLKSQRTTHVFFLKKKKIKNILTSTPTKSVLSIF